MSGAIAIATVVSLLIGGAVGLFSGWVLGQRTATGAAATAEKRLKGRVDQLIAERDRLQARLGGDEAATGTGDAPAPSSGPAAATPGSAGPVPGAAPAPEKAAASPVAASGMAGVPSSGHLFPAPDRSGQTGERTPTRRRPRATSPARTALDVTGGGPGRHLKELPASAEAGKDARTTPPASLPTSELAELNRTDQIAGWTAPSRLRGNAFDPTNGSGQAQRKRLAPLTLLSDGLARSGDRQLQPPASKRTSELRHGHALD